jgi:hypothetical protein
MRTCPMCPTMPSETLTSYRTTAGIMPSIMRANSSSTGLPRSTHPTRNGANQQRLNDKVWQGTFLSCSIRRARSGRSSVQSQQVVASTYQLFLQDETRFTCV